MRFLNGDTQKPVYNVQMYLTPEEARDLMGALEELLFNPEANDHKHVFTKEPTRGISVSLVTATKLERLNRYTKAEQEMFREK